MKRKVLLLVAVLAIVLTGVLGIGTVVPKDVSAATASTFQRVNFVNGLVTASELNVRQGPSEKHEVVCVLKKGQTVKIFGKVAGWYAVYDPAMGCVGAANSQYIKVASQLQAPSTKIPAKVPAKMPTQQPKMPVPQAGNQQPPVNPPSGISAEEQILLNLVNKARTEAGLPALEFDMPLMKVARLKAKDMVDNNYFSHQSPTYGSPFDMMRQFGVTFKTAGENIAGNRSVEGAFDAWMKSEGHRKNILSSSFNFCGFGIVSSPTYGKMLVQQFIGR